MMTMILMVMVAVMTAATEIEMVGSSMAVDAITQTIEATASIIPSSANVLYGTLNQFIEKHQQCRYCLRDDTSDSNSNGNGHWCQHGSTDGFSDMSGTCITGNTICAAHQRMISRVVDCPSK
jgi:hypothetical protein